VDAAWSFRGHAGKELIEVGMKAIVSVHGPFREHDAFKDSPDVMAAVDLKLEHERSYAQWIALSMQHEDGKTKALEAFAISEVEDTADGELSQTQAGAPRQSGRNPGANLLVTGDADQLKAASKKRKRVQDEVKAIKDFFVLLERLRMSGAPRLYMGRYVVDKPEKVPKAGAAKGAKRGPKKAKVLKDMTAGATAKLRNQLKKEIEQENTNTAGPLQRELQSKIKNLTTEKSKIEDEKKAIMKKSEEDHSLMRKHFEDKLAAAQKAHSDTMAAAKKLATAELNAATSISEHQGFLKGLDWNGMGKVSARSVSAAPGSSGNTPASQPSE